MTYNPRQPRNEDGEWASTGSSPAAISSLQSATDSAVKTMPQDQLEAVSYYQHDPSYFNSDLRSSKGRDTDSNTEAMDQMMRKVRTTEDMSLYRGLSGKPAEKLEAGDSFTDYGYASTTNKLSVAKQFATGRYGEPAALMRIRYPKGGHAVWIDSINGELDEDDYGEAEHEVLLPRGLKFRVTGKPVKRDGVTYVDVDAVKK